MTRVKGRKMKWSRVAQQPRKSKLCKIRTAISQFISKTEKIVRSISPHARILLPRLLAHKHPKRTRPVRSLPRPLARDSAPPGPLILTPQFKGI